MNKRKTIPARLREKCFKEYIHDNKCYTGCGNNIDAFNFEAGHVISDKDGGEPEFKNLRPICTKCNKSMGATPMLEYCKDHGFVTKLSSEELPEYSPMTFPGNIDDKDNEDVKILVEGMANGCAYMINSIENHYNKLIDNEKNPLHKITLLKEKSKKIEDTLIAYDFGGNKTLFVIKKT